MQRLFTIFPKGIQGIALVLLRLDVGMTLVGAVPPHWGVQLANWPGWAAAVISASLCLGVVTPVMCLACVAADLMTWSTGSDSANLGHLSAVVGATALALLGPGGYSIDGRLFGLRRIAF